MELTIRWSTSALTQFETAMAHIDERSSAGAIKIKTEILLKIDDILKHPERHGKDKYKSANDGTWRAFELHQYRVSYRYKSSIIRIIRIRHTKMDPLQY